MILTWFDLHMIHICHNFMIRSHIIFFLKKTIIRESYVAKFPIYFFCHEKQVLNEWIHFNYTIRSWQETNHSYPPPPQIKIKLWYIIRTIYFKSLNVFTENPWFTAYLPDGVPRCQASCIRWVLVNVVQ